MTEAYAQPSEVAEYLGIEESALPADITRLLSRATDLIRPRIQNNYDSTNELHVAAVKKAACAQIEYWQENREGPEFEGSVRSRLAAREMTVYINPTPRLAPRAEDALNEECLLYSGVG